MRFRTADAVSNESVNEFAGHPVAGWKLTTRYTPILAKSILDPGLMYGSSWPVPRGSTSKSGPEMGPARADVWLPVPEQLPRLSQQQSHVRTCLLKLHYCPAQSSG